LKSDFDVFGPKEHPMKIVERNGKRVAIIEIDDNALNDDWIRSARLKRLADAGDEEAKKKMEELENTPMIAHYSGGGDEEKKD
jgi:hypothetical protein